MIGLHPALGGSHIVLGWRLDKDVHAATWDRGIGAYMAGGRWNSAGNYAVYASLDLSTAILEVAVHKGFDALDTIPHTIIQFNILDPSDVHVLDPTIVPNPNWLRATTAGAGQQAYGDDLLAKHKFIAIPSVVTNYSWNVIFSPTTAAGAYVHLRSEKFALDPRLNPAPPRTASPSTP